VRDTLRLALAGLPAAGIAALGALAVGVEKDLHTATTVWAPLDTLPWLFVRCFAGGPLWRCALVQGLALAGLGLALRTWQGRPSKERGLALAAALLLVLWAVAPFNLGFWQFFSPRFLPLAAACALVLLPLERLGRGRRAARVALAAWSGAAAGWAIPHHAALADATAPALSGLDQPLVRVGPRLPVILDPHAGLPADSASSELPFYAPLRNLGQLYMVAHGGAAPYTFATSRFLHGVLYRAEPEAALPQFPTLRSLRGFFVPSEPFTPGERERTLVRAAMAGSQFEDVILWGPEADIERILATGYEVAYRRGRLAIATFRGCPASLAVAGPSQAARWVDVGWAPAFDAYRRLSVPATAGSDESGLTLPDAPCTPLWLRVVESDGAGHETVVRCAEAAGEPLLVSGPGGAGPRHLRCTPLR